ncbi:MAG: hypothetical protein ACLSVD_15365 [Eggerthellaceae bacterium]
MNNQAAASRTRASSRTCRWRWRGHLAGRRQILRGGRPGVRGRS